MSLSVSGQVGVSARLELEFTTIHTIRQLFSNEGVFIHGISCSPIDYNERIDCFDVGIIDILLASKSDAEFNEKLVTVAELRMDDNVICLRRKSEYVSSDDKEYERYRLDDDDTAEYTPFDLHDVYFNFFNNISSLYAEFDNERKNSFDNLGGIRFFMTGINDSISYFNKLGINEDQLHISNYNVLNT